jgi:hypothetical protein
MDPKKIWRLVANNQGTKWSLEFRTLLHPEDEKDVPWENYATISMMTAKQFVWKINSNQAVRPGASRSGKSGNVQSAYLAAIGSR